MVDRLKQSLEHLEPPECPACRVTMGWYRSVLVANSEPALIDHYFQCASCNRIEHSRVPIAVEAPTPPSKLSAPQAGWRKARVSVPLPLR